MVKLGYQCMVRLNKSIPGLLLALLFVVGLLVSQVAEKLPQPPEKGLLRATVVRVIDGDTVVVIIEGERKPVTVRVIGFDAPEKDQPFGDAATKFLKALVEGRKVLLEPDVQAIDRYGRRLYHIWLEPTLLGEIMLLSGLATQMTIPPNVRYAEWFSRSQRLGREIGLGLWSK